MKKENIEKLNMIEMMLLSLANIQDDRADDSTFWMTVPKNSIAATLSLDVKVARGAHKLIVEVLNDLKQDSV